VPGAGTGAHFPFANSAADFANQTTGVDSKYSAVAEKQQQYNGNDWAGRFSFLRNKNVHLTLVPQIRKETKEFSVKGGEASVTMRGCTFGGNGTVSINVGGVTVPIDKETQFPADVSGVDIERKIWVDFIFDTASISTSFPTGISALPFLKQSFTKVVQIVSDMEKV
jgi:hypothetical protein